MTPPSRPRDAEPPDPDLPLHLPAETLGRAGRLTPASLEVGRALRGRGERGRSERDRLARLADGLRAVADILEEWELDAGRRERLGVGVPPEELTALADRARRGAPEPELLARVAAAFAAADRRLATYGSLSPGQSNHDQLADLPGDWSDAAVWGRLEDRGWGVEMGYPGLRPDAAASPVPVELFRSPGLPRAWDRLDRFEGRAYRRDLVPVATRAGVLLANLYALEA